MSGRQGGKREATKQRLSGKLQGGAKGRRPPRKANSGRENWTDPQKRRKTKRKNRAIGEKAGGECGGRGSGTKRAQDREEAIEPEGQREARVRRIGQKGKSEGGRGARTAALQDQEHKRRGEAGKKKQKSGPNNTGTTPAQEPRGYQQAGRKSRADQRKRQETDGRKTQRRRRAREEGPEKRAQRTGRSARGAPRATIAEA